MNADQLPMALALLGVIVATLAVLARGMLRIRIARRLKLASGGLRGGSAEATLAERSAELRGGVGRAFATLGALMPLGDDDRQKISAAVRRAGLRSSNAATVVLGTKAACVLFGAIAGLVAGPALQPGLLGWAGGLIGGVLLGVALNLAPELVVFRLAAMRMGRINAGLADAFDLLIVCLESGLTFERALQRTVSDLRAFQPDLADEFRHATLDMSVHGRTREDALGRLAGRLDSRNFRDFATVVAQSERHGTPLADSLRKLAGSVRVATIATMQAKMARLPVLLILPTLAFVLPGILVIVGGPAFIQLTESLGQFGK